MDDDRDRPVIEELRRFVLSRIDEDDALAAEERLPLFDEAERRGRLRVLRTDDGEGLVLVPGPAEAQEEREPVPWAEKSALLREEVGRTSDETVLRLLAGAYDTHHGWQEEWRT